MKLPKFPVLLAMVTCSSIPFVFAVSSAQAADFAFSANFSNSTSLSIFDSTNTLLQSGSGVT